MMKAKKYHPAFLVSFQIYLVLALQYLKSTGQLRLGLWFSKYHLRCSFKLTWILYFGRSLHAGIEALYLLLCLNTPFHSHLTNVNYLSDLTYPQDLRLEHAQT